MVFYDCTGCRLVLSQGIINHPLHGSLICHSAWGVPYTGLNSRKGLIVIQMCLWDGVQKI